MEPPKSGEVRVKILATGIVSKKNFKLKKSYLIKFSQCFTDVSGSRGKILNVKFPVILGHEGAGVVESVGEGVTSFVQGDHVIALFLPHCNKCVMCQSGETNQCMEFYGSQGRGVMDDDTTRFSCKGKQILHFMGCSTFSEYTVMKAYNLTKITKNAPLDKVCVLSCGFTTGENIRDYSSFL